MPHEEELSVAAKQDTVKTVLVVEDDEDTRLLFTEAISMLTPYEVQVARNSTEALHCVKHRKPDLFILDYRLPQITGIQLYDQLHALPGLEHVPAILISGIASEQVTRDIDGRKLIPIEKPFDLDGFLDTVKQALG